MPRQTYKFKKGDEVKISFPKEVLEQARHLEQQRHHNGNRIEITGVEDNGQSYTVTIYPFDILRNEGKMLNITGRKFARYTVPITKYSKLFLPHTCLKYQDDIDKFWEAVKRQ